AADIAPEPEEAPAAPAAQRAAKVDRPPEPAAIAEPAQALQGTLAGSVRSTAGEPVTASVHLLDAQGKLVARTATSDKGEFAVPAPVGIHDRVEIHAAGYPPWRQARVRIVGGQTTRIEAVLQAEQPMRGQVLDPAGNPVSHAFVVRVGPGDQVVATSDNQGHFVISPEAGDMDVVAVHNQFAPSPPAQLSAKGGPPVVLRVGAGGSIAGRVVDGQGRPIAHAHVAIESAHYDGSAVAMPQRAGGLSGADGSFAVGPLRPGEFTVRADAPGKATGYAKDLRVGSGATVSGVTIVLGGGATVRGRVTQKANGQPVAQARVTLLDVRPGLEPGGSSTDAEGNFAITGVGAGLHTLRVDHPEYRAELSSGLQTGDSGEVVRDVQLSARQAGEHFAFQGIGAGLQRDGAAIVIRNIMEGTPAQQAGLQAGDKILGVDRQSTAGLSLPQVIERIRGQEGTTVLLEIERPGQGKFTVQVGRGTVVVKDPQ
ncbi:MAG: carboxypeptidase regulatory-like domain-containing protein, partial [Deltaproteobacteria bacterium]|nr:carboxypeptidase regulatory-like domain-containing protein [Deltaproteobacteria bacterium]